MTSGELRALVHPTLATRAESRAASKVISDLLGALPDVATAALSSIQIATSLAISDAIAKSGNAALAKAKTTPGESFYITVVYTTRTNIAAGPIGAQLGVTNQKSVKNVQAYIYWIN